jgi:hypothetical protein
MLLLWSGETITAVFYSMEAWILAGAITLDGQNTNAVFIIKFEGLLQQGEFKYYWQMGLVPAMYFGVTEGYRNYYWCFKGTARDSYCSSRFAVTL